MSETLDPGYDVAKARLSDREWRIDNLYHIKDKVGVPIPFRRNLAQRTYAKNEWFRDTILKSRKLGFSTYIAIEILDAALFASNTVAGIIDRTVDDAESKLSIAKFAYIELPPAIRNNVRLLRDNNSELAFSNGSSIVAGTS